MSEFWKALEQAGTTARGPAGLSTVTTHKPATRKPPPSARVNMRTEGAARLLAAKAGADPHAEFLVPLAGSCTADP